MAWATEQIQNILKTHYINYFATTKNDLKKKLRARIIKELHQLQKDTGGANNGSIALSDDEEVLDKVFICSNICWEYNINVYSL